MLRTAIVFTMALASVGGCVRVKPHERQILARPDMEIGGDAELRAGESHARAYREGSSGGGEAHAGGCGCN
ncbi:MAG: DUF4266 domain-containing protein [Kofleriaceae bacterium]